jgi:Methane oxygenase PmoA
MLPLLALAVIFSPVARAEDEVRLTRLSDRVRVEIGNSLFTEYIFGDGASRPYCYPILAPDGTPLTRSFPMKKLDGEEVDHPWHRSLWFAHSYVNGVDFWNEAGGDLARSPKAKGHAESMGLSTVSSGSVGVLVATNRWVDPGGMTVCTEHRTLRFHGTPTNRCIDYEVTLHAPADKPLLLGDNKDGTLALRVAQWMTAPHQLSGVEVGGQGHIVTANGNRDTNAWGSRADWCDYYASHAGQTYGLAIFDHPGNLRHPTWWMVRNYGLFAANPFGWHDFENLKDEPHKGDYTIPPGHSLTLRYRIYLHLDDEKAAGIAHQYRDYATGR